MSSSLAVSACMCECQTCAVTTRGSVLVMCAVSDINQRSPLCSLPAHDLLTSTGLSRTGMGPPGERSSSPIKWGVLVEASCRKAHGRRRRVFANYPVASPMQVQPGGLFPGGAGRRRPRPTAPGEQVPEGLNTDREAMLTLSLCSRRRFNKWQNCASRIPIPRFVWVRDERRLHKAGRPLKTADPELPLPPPVDSLHGRTMTFRLSEAIERFGIPTIRRGAARAPW